MSDWTTDAADYVERTVASLRERTVEPAYGISRAIVYGLLAVLIVLPAVILLLVALFRVLVIACQGYVWAAWCIMGGIFVLIGAFLWIKRRP